ncbi:centrosomal protein of 164 kDa isoform X2 [Colius striatus]|uniref:centrosomal protein of 164 kDa isoform X2 n=1 Tax=Colius striatus TaxID=57412 RepID=UPI002B1E1FBD|nr:centrosomal protein of 164 kDa isoform X2 [Colius striatus]
MAGALRVGDQLILEEDDEPYIPTEEEIQSFARDIGIDPEKEPELIWVAREGIAASLPPEWKACQDVTGDVYYFNFANGQSMWDHPCDAFYRELVIREREKLQAAASLKKKDKKKKKEKKKEKKDKKEKESLKRLTPSSALPVPVLPPLRGIPLTSLGSDLGNSGESSLLAKAGPQPAETFKPTSQTKKLLAMVCEEKSSLDTGALYKGRSEEDDSENESLRGTARLFQNLHMDIGALGSTFDCEESLKSRHPEEGQESSLDSDAACPPTPVHVLPGEADGSLSGQDEEGSEGKLAGSELRGKQDAEVEGDISAAAELPQALGERSTAGTDVPGGPGQPRAASPASEAAEACEAASVAATMDAVSGGEKTVDETREEAAADLQTDSRLDAGKLSKGSESVGCEEDSQDIFDCELLRPVDLGFQSRFSERVVVGEVLSPALDGPMCKAQGEEEKALSKASIEEEKSERAEAAERQPQKGIQQEQCLQQPSERSPEGTDEEPELEPQRDKMHLLQNQEEKMQQFQEETRQQEEEAAEKLHQHKEKSLRALKEDLAKACEEEELRVRREEAERLSKLRARIALETQAEEEKIRAEQEVALQKLRAEWESRQVMEKESLERKQQLTLEKMKAEVEEAQQKEMNELEQEKERFLSELKERLDREKKKAVEELEKHFATELQQLKSAAERKHQKVISSLQTQIAEAQRSEEAQLHEDLQRAEQKVQQKAFQVREYERELSELMREKRQEVERDHERKLERLKAQHQEAIARVQDQYKEEERQRRAELTEGLCAEMSRLRQLHHAEAKALQAELDGQLSALQLRHREKERRVQDLESELDLRMKKAQARSAQLLSQEESLRKKRQQLLDEDRQIELERDEAAVASERWLEESRQERARLLESIWPLRRTLGELQDQKAELEAQVDLLQSRSQRLQRRLSELEAAVSRRQQTLKELEAEEEPESPRKAELHVEDLRETTQPLSGEPASPPSQSHEASSFPWDHVRSLVSAEGISIRRAKEFVARQSRSVRRRQQALRAARQQQHRDLEEETKQLDEVKSAVQKGQVLLNKKEEKLSQLESSLLEELSDEDLLKGAACKKMVTFDLSSSENTSSTGSVDLQQPTFDLRSDLQPGSHMDKIQYLTSSLQRFSQELNGFLGVLGSRSGQQPAAPCGGVPLSAYTPLAGLGAASSQWPWGTGLSSGRSVAAAQSVDDLLAEKWRRYFPGGFPLLSGSSRPLENRLGYVPAEEQLRLFQHSHFQSREPDKLSIERMIEANKKWLEDFKRDAKVPLLPAAQLQLGLDEKGHIKVYHN